MLFIVNHVIGVRDLIQSDTLTDMTAIPTATCKMLMLMILMGNLKLALKSLR